LIASVVFAAFFGRGVSRLDLLLLHFCSGPERIFHALIPKAAGKPDDLSVRDQLLKRLQKGPFIGAAEPRQPVIRKVQCPPASVHFHEQHGVDADLVRPHAAHAADEVVLVPLGHKGARTQRSLGRNQREKWRPGRLASDATPYIRIASLCRVPDGGILKIDEQFDSLNSAVSLLCNFHLGLVDARC